MKRSITILLALFPLLSFGADKTSTPAAPKVEVQRTENNAGLKSLLDQMWSSLRKYAPKLSAREASDKNVTLVAGVRGSETTTSTLKPYWKGDKANDAEYVKEVTAYTRAQTAADEGKYQEAAQAFTQFVSDYPKSELKPQAEFAAALAQMSNGNSAIATQDLDRFAKSYPAHPLMPEVQRARGALSAK